MEATAKVTETGAPAKRLVIRWVKSAIGYNVRQKRTLKALGLTRLGQTVEHPDSSQVRGMVNTVVHLVEMAEK